MSDRFITAQVGDDLFLLDELTSASFRLGGIGGRLWELLSAGTEVDDVAQIVAEETGAPIEQVLADTKRFADDLRAAALLGRPPTNPSDSDQA